MDAKTAYLMLTEAYPNTNIIGCVEYDSIFVFQMIPMSAEDTEYLDGLHSVNKKTGEIDIFQPFDIPLAEYKAGKEVVDFKPATTADDNTVKHGEMYLENLFGKNRGGAHE